MTEPTRGARARRGNRRAGSVLLTTLLVLAIVASSGLVFTDRVELLKLAVIVALWAAVVAAFVSFIYRRQSDLDQAKSRDLKLVYDLQLDREISARREYELSIEAQLRRELASEMRAETSDEVAALRAELAALRANLEIIFDTDLQSRPAIETERTFGEWGRVDQGLESAAATPERVDRGIGPGRVISSRIDTEAPDDFDPSTEESPIIDVPAEPRPTDGEWTSEDFGGAHRRASERGSFDGGWRATRPAPRPRDVRPDGSRRTPEPTPVPTPTPTPTPTTEAAPVPATVRLPWQPAEPPPPPTVPSPQSPPQPPPRPEPAVARHAPADSGWRPAPAEGLYVPAGTPGSNWSNSPAGEMAVTASRPVPPPPPPLPTPPPPPHAGEPMTPSIPPTMTAPPTEPPRKGRHYPVQTAEAAEAAASESARRARHASASDPGRPAPPPTLATPTPPPPAAPTPEAAEPIAARHRGADEAPEPEPEPAGQHIGGQPLSELMARLQANATGGGRRRRRDE